jgi:hypothetical protein
MGSRLYISIQTSLVARELMLLPSGEDFRRTEEELLQIMSDLSDKWSTLLNHVVDEDMRPGEYKDINYEND